jgi:hypothetical protein
MQVSAASSAATSQAMLIQVLKAAQEMQTEMAEQLIAAETAMQLNQDAMAIAGQLVDVYA